MSSRYTPQDVADQIGRNKAVSNGTGEHIAVEVCPYCNGGEHRDKWTFALSAENGSYNCKRGNCGAKGSFRDLLQHMGLERDYELTKKPQRTYKKPKSKPVPVDNPQMKVVCEYLKSRGISRETVNRFQVGADEKGNIMVPYYENGQAVLMKYRPSREVQKGERKAWREEGGKPVFYGMDLCVPGAPLVITEGEIDTLSAVEAGAVNSVSIPSGVEDLTCIEECWDWLQQFPSYILWTDNDDPGIRCRDKLIKRLGSGKCYTVHSNRKDANEVLTKDGAEAVLDAINSAKPVPMAGLFSLASITDYDPTSDILIPSGIPMLDENMGGGFRAGEVTVWTGVNSSGKSTALGQILLQAVEGGHRAFAYSGELPARIFRYWVDRQAAGKDCLEMRKRKDGLGESVAVKTDYVKHIRAWYADSFYLYDSNGASVEKTIFDVAEYAVQRYGVRVILLDNLMTALRQDDDIYRKQSQFIGDCMDFAKRYDVHIHVVAHPRKVRADERVTKADIMGSGDITNRADNVIAVHKASVDERQKDGYDNCLMVFKNRYNGQQDYEIRLKFEPIAKRLYPVKGNPDWQYSWVSALGINAKQQALTEWEQVGRVI